MRRGEILAAIVLGAAIGLAVVLYLILTQSHSQGRLADSNITPTPKATTPAYATPTIPLMAQATDTPGILMHEAPEPVVDIDDVLLLYNEMRPTSFSINVCLLAEYYGLGCKMMNVPRVDDLTPGKLLDDNGQPFKLVAIDATLLDAKAPLLSSGDIEVLMSAVNEQGMNLLVGKVDNLVLGQQLSRLTNSRVNGVAQVNDSTKDWMVTAASPEITRELSGQVVQTSQAANPDTFALQIEAGEGLKVLFSSNDDNNWPYPFFVAWQMPDQPATGTVFLDAGETGQPLNVIALREVFYSAASFSQITPTMMVLRYALGDEAWHRDVNYANLTIDEAALTEPYQDLNYTALLELMKRHNFHTSIAMTPKDWQESESDVIALILTNPNYFSVVQFGNNAEGYEFYRYSTPEADEPAGNLLRFSSLQDQERSILEGLARMQLHQTYTRIPSEKIMILPGGICPEETFLILKANNYLATVNAQDAPLDAVRPTAWDYGMYPAVSDYGCFPNLIRRAPNENISYQPYYLASILDLFIDKPALFYTFPYGSGMFSTGMDAFDPLADEINRLGNRVEWRSLEYIARHLYLQKTNDDGSISVKMYTRQLVYQNETDASLKVHFSLAESGEVSLASVRVNGFEFPYDLEDGFLWLNIEIPAHTQVEINVEYRAAQK